MSNCAKCGTHLRSVDGVCPTCMARSITSFLRSPRADDEAAEVPGYELHEIIGRGGMGIVFRATRSEDGCVVAVKLLPTQLADDEDIVDRFAREAHALAAFDHAHVLRVLDSGITIDGRLFLVTELAAGGDLAKRLQAGALPLELVVRMYREVLEAIAEAHRKGIAHRDIKPANILLDERDGVRVGDFSLAKLLRNGAAPQLTMTQSADAFGTPYYIAPEVRRGAGSVDERADIFSLGVLLHEMLTGRVPMGNYEPASRSAPVNARMDELIGHCLREDPAKRPPDIAALRAAFDSALRPQWQRLGWIALLVILAAFGFLILAKHSNSKPTPSSATREQPWTNSLGMKFVPVPNTSTLFCIWETRRRDFAVFARERPGLENERLWMKQENDPGDDHPATPVSWLRAEQFCEWLTRKEHSEGRLPVTMGYRLPRDAEWSLAVGLPPESGTNPEAKLSGMVRAELALYPWGRTWPPPDKDLPANFAGRETDGLGPPFTRSLPSHHDAWPYTAPVGSFVANAFGLFDMSGNVSEWCLDNWNTKLPDKTLRGGNYHDSDPSAMRLNARDHAQPPRQLLGAGFRVVVDLTAP